ncbi:MAG: hypothetical protein M3P15_09195 [Actinomycetota bacterium]|nr:hypothetical protein [Actinomycetota bacterium]
MEARYLALGIVCVICVVGLMNGCLAASVLGDGISGFVKAPAPGPRAGNELTAGGKPVLQSVLPDVATPGTNRPQGVTPCSNVFEAHSQTRRDAG